MLNIPCPVMSDLRRYLDDCDRREAYLAEVEKLMLTFSPFEVTGSFTGKETDLFNMNMEILIGCRGTPLSIETARTEIQDLFHDVRRRMAEEKYQADMKAAAEEEAINRYYRLMGDAA